MVSSTNLGLAIVDESLFDLIISAVETHFHVQFSTIHRYVCLKSKRIHDTSLIKNYLDILCYNSVLYYTDGSYKSHYLKTAGS